MTDYGPPDQAVTTPAGVSLTPDLARRLREMVDVLPEPTACREWLGKALGYCPGAVQTTDINGRGFCTEHAKERGF